MKAVERRVVEVEGVGWTVFVTAEAVLRLSGQDVAQVVGGAVQRGTECLRLVEYQGRHYYLEVGPTGSWVSLLTVDEIGPNMLALLPPVIREGIRNLKGV
jgi:hypothetical protein